MILNTLFGAQMAPERQLAPANTPVSQVEGARPAGIGGFLGSLRDRWTTPNAQGLDFGQRLTRFGAELQDIGDGGQRAAAIHQRAEAERKQKADAARRQQMNAAIQAAYRPDGTFDRQAFARSAIEGGMVDDLGDVTSLIGGERDAPQGYRWNGDGLELIPGYAEGQATLRPPSRPRIYNGDINGDGVNDLALEDDVYAMLQPGGQAPAPQAAPRAAQQGLPPLPPGFTLNRPNQAASPTGGVAAPGQGFGGYDEIRSFLTDFSPGARVTSMGRSQALQDDLYRRGKTPTRNSTHVEGRGLGTDYVPRVPFDQWEAEAERLRATGRFRTVRIETGRGRNQGTGPHIHLEPVR